MVRPEVDIWEARQGYLLGHWTLGLRTIAIPRNVEEDFLRTNKETPYPILTHESHFSQTRNYQSRIDEEKRDYTTTVQTLSGPEKINFVSCAKAINVVIDLLHLNLNLKAVEIILCNIPSMYNSTNPIPPTPAPCTITMPIKRLWHVFAAE